MAPARLEDVLSSNGADNKPTVYVMDTFHPEAIKHCQHLFNAILPGTKEWSNWRQNARYLLIRSSALTREDVESCPNLIAIGKQGVGIDKIDAQACAERGIPIFNTPGVNARAVAELVLTLSTSVAREIGPITAKQSTGILVPKEKCSGLILYEKKIGILGMGHIGKTVAKIFRGAFDASVIAYDPFLPSDAWADIPHTRASTVEQVLKEADIVTIHIPLTPQTKGLISLPQLRMMKDTAILINTARGGIVNEDDLALALEEGAIWGAGLDCHVQEPPSKERYEKLWHQRVVSTPHIGAATSQTQFETAKAAVDGLHNFIIKNVQ